MLEVRDLETAYGRSQVLFKIGFQIKDGEVVTLLGRNGMGKTTTVRSIMGMTPCRGGTISFRQKEITRLPSYRIAQAGDAVGRFALDAPAAEADAAALGAGESHDRAHGGRLAHAVAAEERYRFSLVDMH